MTSQLAPYGKLILNKLVALGVPRAAAKQMLDEQRIRHQWGPKKRDVEYLSFRTFLSSSIGPRWGLETAEHIARVFHNWQRCYHVDTTRLAMRALAAAREASAKFGVAQKAYRSRQIGDVEFLAARAEWIASSKAFDEARGEAA